MKKRDQKLCRKKYTYKGLKMELLDAEKDNGVS